ncbi:hypothetical protein GF314_13860 [bacterium]|nr:hypothetical protein [bacterium]
MTRHCPECGHRLPAATYLGYLRLGSMPCPQCRTLLAIDGRARSTFWIAVIVAALLAAATMERTGSEPATAAVMLLGLAASVVLLTRTSTLRVAPDDPTGKAGETGRQSRD